MPKPLYYNIIQILAAHMRRISSSSVSRKLNVQASDCWMNERSQDRMEKLKHKTSSVSWSICIFLHDSEFNFEAYFQLAIIITLSEYISWSIPEHHWIDSVAVILLRFGYEWISSHSAHSFVPLLYPLPWIF